MISKIYNEGRILWLPFNDEACAHEPPILVHIDSGGTLCIEQEGATICLNAEDVKELIDLLKFYLPKKSKGE